MVELLEQACSDLEISLGLSVRCRLNRLLLLHHGLLNLLTSMLISILIWECIWARRISLTLLRLMTLRSLQWL